MVQWLADPASHGGSSSSGNSGSGSSSSSTTTTTTTEVARNVLPPKRPARRGYSVTDFQGDVMPDFLAALQTVSLHNNSISSSTNTTSTSPPSSSSAAGAHIPTEASIPENAVLRTAPPSVPLSTRTQQALVSALRPQAGKKKQPPRRSYSATDKEPEDAVLAPDQPRPPPPASSLRGGSGIRSGGVGVGVGGGAGGLLDLPPELHYTLFDFLDPIDAVCLGLAHPALYAVHRRKNSRVPLSSRYNGPNDLEWVWRGVRHLNQRGGGGGSGGGDMNHNSSSGTSTPITSVDQQETTSISQQQRQQQQKNEHSTAGGGGGGGGSALDKLRVKGQVYCRKCGISRCELHRHIKSWMGDGYQYCEIKERFGPPAPDGAKSYCFMSSPKDRHRCGRHGALRVAGAGTTTSSSGRGGSSSRNSPATTPAAAVATLAATSPWGA
ncbi:F-box domain-containing protein [Cordyceps javanica]|uniref:F-box domain-containing protein n=1 Tax=Cordyceps javanica TaxID=43265 RepID=A0A545VR51_9HYPO|nr:F-box domain-containing protein [Cordyceps javanica]TQW04186.1 F-box domain-containing protein [Cordyceps javanica]